MAKPKNLLAGQRYKLKLGAAAAPPKQIASPWVHLGVVGSGVALGYITYPYAQNPLGMTLMGAAGSIVAVGVLLLVYDALRDKHLIENAT